MSQPADESLRSRRGVDNQPTSPGRRSGSGVADDGVDGADDDVTGLVTHCTSMPIERMSRITPRFC
ncbi:MAG: hypothetical protein ACKOYI_09390, partial [Actinomycetota bacterium]